VESLQQEEQEIGRNATDPLAGLASGFVDRNYVDGVVEKGRHLYRAELRHGRDLIAMASTQATTEAMRAVIAAAERGAQLAGGDQRYIAIAKTAMEAVGAELARQIEHGESASVCAPVDVAHDGRHDPGMVLLLNERVVIAWFEGTLRVKRRSLAFSYRDISEVATAARDRGRLSPYRDGISFAAGGARQEFVLPSKVAKDGLTSMIKDLLTGAVSFGQE
jgi:hypothetical protein